MYLCLPLFSLEKSSPNLTTRGTPNSRNMPLRSLVHSVVSAGYKLAFSRHPTLIAQPLGPARLLQEEKQAVVDMAVLYLLLKGTIYPMPPPWPLKTDPRSLTTQPARNTASIDLADAYLHVPMHILSHQQRSTNSGVCLLVYHQLYIY